MQPEIVLAVYRPRGDVQPLLDLIARHVPTLREQGLATERPVLLLRERASGALIEIFEWVSPEAAERAHSQPAVQALWEAFAELVEFTAPGALPGMDSLFPHFEAIDGIVR